MASLPTPRRSRLPLRLAAVPVTACVIAGVALTAAPPAAADIQQQIASAQQRLDQLDSQAEAAAERYNGGRIKLAQAQRTAATASARLGRAQAALVAARQRVNAFAATAYRTGGDLGMLDALTSADGPQTLVDRAATIQAVSRSQADALATIARARHAQQQAQADADAAVAAQRDVVASLDSAKAVVAAKAQEAQQVLKQLQARQAELLRQAREKAAREAAARALAAARARAAALAAAARAFAEQQASAASAAVQAPAAPVRHYSGDTISIVLQAARDQLGKPYVWGASGPDTFDCSGLTMYAYAQAGISLPHYTGAQWNAGRHVSRGELQPGDLVFFGSDLHHVGMYVGNGQMIEAPHSGANVRYADAFRSDYAGAVRIVG